MLYWIWRSVGSLRAECEIEHFCVLRFHPGGHFRFAQIWYEFSESGKYFQFAAQFQIFKYILCWSRGSTGTTQQPRKSLFENDKSVEFHREESKEKRFHICCPEKSSLSTERSFLDFQFPKFSHNQHEQFCLLQWVTQLNEKILCSELVTRINESFFILK